MLEPKQWEQCQVLDLSILFVEILGIYVKHLVENWHIFGKKFVSLDKEFVFGQNLSRGN